MTHLTGIPIFHVKLRYTINNLNQESVTRLHFILWARQVVFCSASATLSLACTVFGTEHTRGH